MKRLFDTLSTVLAVALTAATASANTTTLPAHAGPRGGGFSIPIAASSLEQGTFQGQLRVTQFASSHGQIVALGVVTGTLVDAAGLTHGIVRNVSLPVIGRAADGAGSALSPSPLATCDVLHLELGPLDLDLLGLVVHLDRVVLDVSAVSGAGNLLGNLLCAITNLLNGTGPVGPIVTLLNDLLASLG